MNINVINVIISNIAVVVLIHTCKEQFLCVVIGVMYVGVTCQDVCVSIFVREKSSKVKNAAVLLLIEVCCIHHVLHMSLIYSNTVSQIWLDM